MEVCPFGAIDWNESEEAPGKTSRVAMVNPAECKGCGLCAASCLSGAVQMRGFTDEQILAMVNTTFISTP